MTKRTTPLGKKSVALVNMARKPKDFHPFSIPPTLTSPHRAPLEREKRNISGKREKKRKTTEKKTSEKRSFSPTLLAPFWKKKKKRDRTEKKNRDLCPQTPLRKRSCRNFSPEKEK